MKVLLFDFRESEKDFFKNNTFCDFDIKFFEEPLNDKTKLSDNDYSDTDVLCVYRTSILNNEILQKFKNLRIVATRSFGFNHIDIDYCAKNHIAVLRTDQYGEEAVAEYALGLILALERRIKMAILDIQKNNINHKMYEGNTLKNLTIGIIGCGKVGIRLAQIAKFFDMQVLVSSYKEDLNFTGYCNVVQFDELLTKSDIIYLHMPFTTETYRIIGENEISRMKNGVLIINTSSVELIDLKSLYENLLSGKIKGAALDTLDSDYLKAKKLQNIGNETMSSDENKKITSKLLTMPNVIITPHIAYNTSDTIDYVLETTINNIKDCIKGFSTNRVV